MIDPISEADLNAYVDDALDLKRRIEVEDYLARDPAAAVRVMADLSARDALRAAVSASPLGPAPERALVLAHRLDRALTWRRFGQRLRRVAAVAVLVGAGWLAHSQASLSDTDSERPPAIVEDALHARHAVLVRARMASQSPAPRYDRDDVRSATGIELPDLPGDWRVRDLQVFPTREGQGVEVSIDAGPLGPVSLFAARAVAADPADPAIVRGGEGVTLHWRGRSSAYALTGNGDEPALGRVAARMASTLR